MLGHFSYCIRTWPVIIWKCCCFIRLDNFAKNEGGKNGNAFVSTVMTICSLSCGLALLLAQSIVYCGRERRAQWALYIQKQGKQDGVIYAELLVYLYSTACKAALYQLPYNCVNMTATTKLFWNKWQYHWTAATYIVTNNQLLSLAEH